MASDLLIFKGGVVPTSDAARARIEQAAALKQEFLSASYTREIYGPAAAEEWDVRDEDLMPNPDELASRWGCQDIDKVCNDMAGNVLQYGALVEGRMDVSMSLKVSWMVGVKGDPESEQARDEIEAIYKAIPERFTVEREMCRMAERGFMGAENVFDQLDIAGAKGIVSIAQMFNRPMSYFGFDRRHRPYFKPSGRFNDPQRIDGFKVTFGRQGSLHTRYGAGFAQRCYPTVFAIDRLLKQHMAAVERWSWVPVIMKHPMNWTDARRRQEHANLKQQWKNVLLVPAEVDKPEFSTLSDGAYANSNATGMSRMALVKDYVTALAMFVRGSQSTSGSDTGSFAKEATLDNAQLWKAPTDAAAREAMWNRGLVEPTMLANRPTLERHKWPRCSIDASFGEDLRLFMELCESGARHGVRIAAVTWSERTGIPLATEEDEAEGNILTPAQSTAPLLPDGFAADEVRDPVTGVVKRLSEERTVRVTLADGRVYMCRPHDLVLTDRGPVFANDVVGQDARRVLHMGRGVRAAS